MMILVNVFAIGSAVLFYTKKIRPEPFLLGSFIWIFMMLAVWYILPYSIYSKSSTFKETFTSESQTKPLKDFLKQFSSEKND